MARNLLANGDFENRTGNNFDDWGENALGSTTITAETSDVFNGTACCKLTGDASNSWCAIYQDSITTIGQEYTISFWAKNIGSSDTQILTSNWCVTHTFDIPLGVGWKQYSYTAIANGTQPALALNGANDIVLIDKVRLEPTPVKYAVKTLLLSDDIASPNTDFFISGFGTPKAAIVLMSYAYEGGNPALNAQESIGFLDSATSQVCAIGASTGGQVTTATYRSLPTSRVAKATSAATTLCDYSAATVVGSGITITMESDATAAKRYATVIMFSGHDVESDVGVFNPSNGNIVSLIGFKPTVLFCICAGVPFGSTNQTYNIWSFGAAQQRPTVKNSVVGVRDAPSVGTSDNYTQYSTSYMAIQAGTTAPDWATAFNSFNADGFEQTVNASTGGDYVGYLALKIPGINVNIHHTIVPTSTGSQTITGIGFKPGLLIGCSHRGVLNTIKTDGMGISYGASDGTTEGSYANYSADGVNTTICGSKYVESLINQPTSSGHAFSVANVSSFDVDGYTLNWTSIAEPGASGWMIALQDQADSKKLIGTASGKIYFKQ